LAGDVEMNLYRLTQEALHNVLKHARASHVTVFAEQRDRQLVLVIGDDGRGFDPAETHERPGSGGLGLVNMRERANLIGATIQIDSAPGHGTAISVRVPIHGSLSQPCIVA